MKKKIRYVFMILLISIAALLVVIIYCFKSKNENIKIQLDAEDYTDIIISYRSHKYKINNMEKIKEIADVISNYDYDGSKSKKSFTNNSKYVVKFISEQGNDNIISISESGVGYKGKIFKTDEMYEYMADITSYCIMCMNKIGYETYKWEIFGLDMSKEEAIDEYNLMINALPIRESEFKTGDSYFYIRTYDEEDIYVYYVADEKYISYEKSGIISYFKVDVESIDNS